jgi:hypothetical protein
MTWSCWPGNIRLVSFAATFVRLEVKTEYDTLEVREAEKAEARQQDFQFTKETGKLLLKRGMGTSSKKMILVIAT